MFFGLNKFVLPWVLKATEGLYSMRQKTLSWEHSHSIVLLDTWYLVCYSCASEQNYSIATQNMFVVYDVGRRVAISLVLEAIY